MAALTDEILMAYADGALDRETRARVEALLHQDAQSRRRVEMFRATGAPLAGLFSKAMNEPVPAHLVDLVLQDRVAPFAPARLKRLRATLGAWGERLTLGPQGPSWQLAAASAAAIVLSASAGWVLHGAFGEAGGPELAAWGRGQIFAVGAFQNILEGAPSGREVRVTGPAHETAVLRVSLTFKNKEGHYCREYEIAATGGGQFAGFACRQASGSWAVLAQLPEATPRPGAQTIPAGYETALDSVVDRMMTGDALGKTEEEAAIANGWK